MLLLLCSYYIVTDSCNPMDCSLPTDCSPPDPSVPGTLQARILEWVAMPSLLQGIFPTQGSNQHLLHWQADSLPLSYL